jgi:recombination protein RecA
MPPRAKKEAATTTAAVLEQFQAKGLNVGVVPREQKFVTTGNVAIDWVCGGGLPIGKVIEFYGASGSGKTTAAIQSCVSVQESGGVPVWLDYERAFDEDYAKALGLDLSPERFIYVKPSTLEEGCDLVRDLVLTGEVQLVVFDSIARMTTEAELKGSMADKTVADKAKALYKFIRIVLNALDDNDCSVIFLNHLLEAINTSMPGVTKKYTPGGNGVTYFASLRLQFALYKSIASSGDDSKYKGLDIEVLCTKNRVAPPSRRVIVRNDFGAGFNPVRSALEIAKELGLVTGGTWTTINDSELVRILGKEKFQGYDAFVLAVTQNPEARGAVVSAARAALAGAA